MKKYNKFLLILASSAGLVVGAPLLSVSCMTVDKEKINLSKFNVIKKNYEIPVYEFSKVGTIFNKSINYRMYVTDEKGNKTIKEVSQSLWDYYNYIEGEVTRIFDGDTIEIKVTKQPNPKPGGKVLHVPTTMKLRIPMIDTLEENTPEVGKEEKELAKKDHAYAEKLIPIGSKVRVISSNWSEKTYDRFVGYVFFGKNFERQFDIEMLAGGYTLARLDTTKVISEFIADLSKESTEAKEIRSYLLPYAAYAINYGILNRKGFYGEVANMRSPYELSSKYLEHGQGMVDFSLSILHYNYWKKPKLATKKNNIYRYLEQINQNKK